MKQAYQQIAERLAIEINQADKRVSAFAENGQVVGSFRGKQKENYIYDLETRSFVFNNEGPNISKAIAAAIDIVKF